MCCDEHVVFDPERYSRLRVMSVQENLEALRHRCPCKTTAEDYPTLRVALITARDWWLLNNQPSLAAYAQTNITRLDAEFGILEETQS